MCNWITKMMRGIDLSMNAPDGSRMSASQPPNQLLQMLDVADFDLLRPHLVTVELVRGLPWEKLARRYATPTSRTADPSRSRWAFPKDR